MEIPASSNHVETDYSLQKESDGTITINKKIGGANVCAATPSCRTTELMFMFPHVSTPCIQFTNICAVKLVENFRRLYNTPIYCLPYKSRFLCKDVMWNEVSSFIYLNSVVLRAEVVFFSFMLADMLLARISNLHINTFKGKIWKAFHVPLLWKTIIFPSSFSKKICVGLKKSRIDSIFLL